MSGRKTIVIKPALLRVTKKKKTSQILDSIPSPVASPVAPVASPVAPVFGCLKNGTKPTRRARVVTVDKFGRTNNKTISVRINDVKTIKSIEKEKNKLASVSLKDVIEYTTAHNLTRVGTTAPENVIRTMYEAARLTGDITNDNSGNLLHNYNHST